MTVEIIYIPTVRDYIGLDDYVFDYDIVGAIALEVWAVDAADVRTFIAPTDYTLVLNGTAPIYDGGTITLTAEAPVGTVFLSLERNTPITQLVDLQQYGKFSADVVEFMIDKLTMICQEIAASKCDKVDQTP